VVEKRRLWKERQKELPADRLVFIDESCAKTNLTRLRGRAPRGKRVFDHAPAGQWNATTMLSSLRLDGTTACMVIEGAADALVLREYIRHILAPTLRPGDIVIYDNVNFHRDVLSIQLIEAQGVQLLFLPPYSPDLTPIEKMWSKVKEFLRKAKARTHESLLTAIAQALASITPQDAQGFFRHTGYLCTIY